MRVLGQELGDVYHYVVLLTPEARFDAPSVRLTPLSRCLELNCHQVCHCPYVSPWSRVEVLWW